MYGRVSAFRVDDCMASCSQCSQCSQYSQWNINERVSIPQSSSRAVPEQLRSSCGAVWYPGVHPLFITLSVRLGCSSITIPVQFQCNFSAMPVEIQWKPSAIRPPSNKEHAHTQLPLGINSTPNLSGLYFISKNPRGSNPVPTRFQPGPCAAPVHGPSPRSQRAVPTRFQPGPSARPQRAVPRRFQRAVPRRFRYHQANMPAHITAVCLSTRPINPIV